jgi:hypothetical protein
LITITSLTVPELISHLEFGAVPKIKLPFYNTRALEPIARSAKSLPHSPQLEPTPLTLALMHNVLTFQIGQAKLEFQLLGEEDIQKIVRSSYLPDLERVEVSNGFSMTQSLLKKEISDATLQFTLRMSGYHHSHLIKNSQLLDLPSDIRILFAEHPR